MAGLRFSTNVEVAAVSAIKTMLQIASPTNQAVKIRKVGISFAGVVNTDAPIEVHLSRQTTAGTMSGNTPVKLDQDRGETIQSTCLENATVEPTTTDVLERWRIHPQTGLVIPYFDEDIIIAGGERVGLIIATAPSPAVIIAAYIHAEE